MNKKFFFYVFEKIDINAHKIGDEFGRVVCSSKILSHKPKLICSLLLVRFSPYLVKENIISDSSYTKSHFQIILIE